MDAPQWYNSRLWNTSKQSIDGKSIKPPLRPQSANTGAYKPRFNIQPMTGNWTNFMRGQIVPLSNRDNSFTYRYSSPYRQDKSPINKLSNSFVPKYYNSISPSFNFSTRNTDRVTSAQLSFNKQRPPPANGESISLQGEPKMLTTSNCNQMKYGLKPALLDFESRFSSQTNQQEVVHGNINIDNLSKESSSDIDILSTSFGDVATLTEPSVPPNTPRIINTSSQINQPTKSILKKATGELSQSKLPTFTFYNNFPASKVRTISASAKSLISTQVSSVSDLRRSLQSAPSSKREVRFDMTNTNVIEYSPND